MVDARGWERAMIKKSRDNVSREKFIGPHSSSMACYARIVSENMFVIVRHEGVSRGGI